MDILDLINSAKKGDANSFFELGKLTLANEEELNSDTIGAAILYFKKAVTGGCVDGLVELMKMYDTNSFTDYKFILNNMKKFALKDSESKLKILKYITNEKSKFYSPVVIKFIAISVLRTDLTSKEQLDLSEILVASPIDRDYLATEYLKEIEFSTLSPDSLFACLLAFSAGMISGEEVLPAIDKSLASKVISVLEKIDDKDVKLKLLKILSSGEDFEKVNYKLADSAKAKAMFEEMIKSNKFENLELVRIYGAGLTFDNKSLKELKNDKKAKELLMDCFNKAKGDDRYIIAQIFGSGKNSNGLNFGLRSEEMSKQCLDKIADSGAGYDKLEVAKIYGTGYDNDRDYYGFKDKELCLKRLNSTREINTFYQREVDKILKTGRDSLNNNYGIFEDEAFEDSTMNMLTSFANDFDKK